MSSAHQQIAIIGGGIGGLACAGFLHAAGIACTIYEQAAGLTEIGAGLVVAPNAVKALRRLGVADRLLEQAVQLDVGWEFRRWEDGTVLSWEDLKTSCRRLFGENTYAAHRADLLGVLLSALPEGALRLGNRCTAITLTGDQPELSLEDGSVIRPDLVIGADGIHSRARQVVAAAQQPTFSGMCAYRALVPRDVAPEFARRPAQTLWLGPGGHVVHYPVSSGRSINLVAFAPAGDAVAESWSATATVTELLAEFAGWDPRLTDLLRSAGTLGRWALLDRPPLASITKGRLALIGDAAHPMFPFFAQGAAQAIEDAAVLAQCIADDDDLSAAVARYEAIRLPRTTLMQVRSRGRADVNHLPDGAAQRARDQAFDESDPLVTNSWIYGYDIGEALQSRR